MIYLSPTEHDLQQLIPKSTYRISRICEDNGVDIIVVTKKGFVGYQRKTLQDLRASLVDGRLYKELGQLRSSQIIKYPFLVLEYDPGRVTVDGKFLDADISITTLWSLLTKVQLLGVYHLNARDINRTVDLIQRVASYIASDKATLLHRPTPTNSGWGTRDNQDYLCYLLQSFPGIGPTTASSINSHFKGRPLLRWDVSIEDLTQVPGIGKKTAARIHAILNTPPA